MNAFFVTVPHSGEEIAPETPWLRGLPETTLMRDVDRFVDRLYNPALQQLNIATVQTRWHRYVVDLNRYPDDIDQQSVRGATLPAGSHPKGFHWSVTTHNEPLIAEPMSLETHRLLVKKYYEPFHNSVEQFFAESLNVKGTRAVYQIDAHSMPSRGTQFHFDPGQYRAEIVLGDVYGTSCSENFRQLVEDAYVRAGFEVVMNTPYKGGCITERYGRPAENRHTIQVEMNRALYMDEDSKKLLDSRARSVEKAVLNAIEHIQHHLPEL